MPCFREKHETSVGSYTSIALFQGPRPASRCLQYGPTRTARDGKMPGNEAGMSTYVMSQVLLPRNYKLSLIPRLSLKSQEGALNHLHSSFSHNPTDVVTSWTSHSNSEFESESEITIMAIIRSGARQRKEGKRSEPPFSTVIRLQHSISAYACRRDQSGNYFRYTSGLVRSGVLTRAAF